MCLNIFLGGNPMNAHSKEKEKLAREALGLWALYGERYRNTPELYSALLSEKMELGLPLHRGERLSKNTLADYPDIALLRATNQELVWKKLQSMDEAEILKAINEMENLEFNYVFRTLQSLIVDFRYQISSHNKPRPRLGMDPNYIRSSGRQVKHSTPNYD